MKVEFKEGVPMQDSIRALITIDTFTLGINDINEMLAPFDAKIFSINEGSVPGIIIESTKSLLLG